jgi:CBS domain containing-hemolysin-like protein
MGLIFIFTPVAVVFTNIFKFLKFILVKLFGRNAKEPTITGDEFQAIVETIEDEGILEPQESRIIRSAVEFSDICAKDVMTPREDIVALDIRFANEKIRDIVLNEKFSRIPVYRGNIDNIVGVIMAKDCLLSMRKNKPIALEKIISKPYIVSPDKPIDALFEDMCRFRKHLAVIADKGKTLGIVTMEDILEVIVGEIYDEDEAAAGDGKADFNLSALASANAQAKEAAK